jgi:hypothetical protein
VSVKKNPIQLPLQQQQKLSQPGPVLRTIAPWYKKNFQVKLDYGVVTCMLEVAALRGDQDLAEVAFQILKDDGHAPSVSNFFCVIRASLISGNYVPAIEALQYLEHQQRAELEAAQVAAQATYTQAMEMHTVSQAAAKAEHEVAQTTAQATHAEALAAAQSVVEATEGEEEGAAITIPAAGIEINPSVSAFHPTAFIPTPAPVFTPVTVSPSFKN